MGASKTNISNLESNSSNMNNMNNMNKKNPFKSFYKGVIKMIKLPVLPNKLLNIHNNIWVKTFRYIGALCLMLNIGKWYKYNKIINFFNDYPSWIFDFIIYLICFISILYVIYIVIIQFTKFIYRIYILIFRPELYEIRNSPIDKISKIGSIIAGAAVAGSDVGIGTFTAIGGGLAYDAISDAAGYGKPIQDIAVKAIHATIGEPNIDYKLNQMHNLYDKLSQEDKNVFMDQVKKKEESISILDTLPTNNKD